MIIPLKVINDKKCTVKNIKVFLLLTDLAIFMIFFYSIEIKECLL